MPMIIPPMCSIPVGAVAGPSFPSKPRNATGLMYENWELYSLYCHILKWNWRIVEQTHNHGTYHFWLEDSKGRNKLSLTLR